MQEPTARTMTAALVSLAFLSDLQLDQQHSCCNLKWAAAHWTNWVLHFELPLHRPSMGLGHVTKQMFKYMYTVNGQHSATSTLKTRGKVSEKNFTSS